MLCNPVASMADNGDNGEGPWKYFDSYGLKTCWKGIEKNCLKENLISILI